MNRKYQRHDLERKKSVSLVPVHALMATFLMVVLSSAPVLAGQDNDLPKILRAGFLSRVFHDIDHRDAQAATELLTRELSRNLGLKSSPKVIIFPDTKSMTAAIRRGELDLVSMPTLDYLRIRETVSLIPAFVGAHNDGMGTRFILIARRDSGIRKFSDLKGKKILLLQTRKHEPSLIWLEVLLMREGKKSAVTFFYKTIESAKASHSIMGVFFRQVDAAIVTRAAYDASRLLNPQIDRELTVLSESKSLSDGVTCFPANTSDRLRSTLFEAINKLSGSATGRQLYIIFQTSGTTPFKPTQLNGLEELLREHARLKKQLANRM